MRCLTDEQLERLAAAPNDDTTQVRFRAHAHGCAKCRKKLEQVQADAAMIGDVRELREHRDKVKSLLDTMPETGTSLA